MKTFFSLSDVPSGEIKSESSGLEGQKPETPCQSNGKGEQLADTLEQNKSDTKTHTKPAAGGKVSTSKAQSKPARKPGSKQLSAVQSIEEAPTADF